jgi:PKHD-type hydroxylase
MRNYDWYTFYSIYSVAECEEIVEICKNNQSLLRYDKHGSKKNVNTTVVDTNALGNRLDKFFNFVQDANNSYFGYKLFKERPLAVHLNIYENEKNEYPYHNDGKDSGTMSDLKLTAILNISLKPYKGGDFYVFLGEDCKVEGINATGNILIFPSFLYHKVTPVTEGQRITLATWLEGPNFK